MIEGLQRKRSRRADDAAERMKAVIIAAWSQPTSKSMDEQPPSKSQRKRQMHDLQNLGVQLAALNPQQLATLDLPENLRAAIDDARHINAFEGRRRQMQYIGKLMRKVDPEPIRRRVEELSAPAQASVARLHHIEHWRNRLLNEEGALAELLHNHPRANVQRLRELITATAREREQGRPPRSFRLLFKMLSEIMETPDREPEDAQP